MAKLHTCIVINDEVFAVNAGVTDVISLFLHSFSRQSTAWALLFAAWK